MVTNVVTGESVAIDHGDLALAIRASMSLPGMFAPQRIDGESYVDGGVVNNMPVDTVREMGADVVIAVDIGSRLRGEEELSEIMDFSVQSRAFLSRQAVEDMLSRADIVLSPELPGLRTLAFSERETILRLGREEAEDELASLTSYALSDAEYERHLRRRQARALSAENVSYLKSITIKGAERVDERVVRRRIRLKAGDLLDFGVLHDALDRIFGLGDFEWVDFDLDSQEDGADLTILLKEKFWGPNYVHAGLELGIDSDENTTINPLINYTRTRLNALGGEWRTEVVFGSQQILFTELYQPLRFDGRLFCVPSFTAERIHRKFVVENQEQVEFESNQYLGRFDLGVNLGTYGEIRAGLFRGQANISLESTNDPLSDRIELGGFSFAVLIDRLNSITFPRKGVLAAASVFRSRPELDARDAYDVFGVSFVWAASRRNHTFLYWMEGGTTFDDAAPSYADFSIGGFYSLSGYDRGELSGPHFGIVRPTYFYRVGTLPSLFGKGIYVGGWLEAGNVWPTTDAISFDDLRYAATAAVGAETVLGPVYVAYGVAEDDRKRLYLSIGRKF
jgi:NTE family protein